MSSITYEEGFRSAEDGNGWKRLVNKCKEQPLVGIGTFATLATLVGATLNFRKGNRIAGQQMLRYRIYSQTLTLLALAGGSIYYANNRDNKKIRTPLP